MEEERARQGKSSPTKAPVSAAPEDEELAKALALSMGVQEDIEMIGDDEVAKAIELSMQTVTII